MLIFREDSLLSDSPPCIFLGILHGCSQASQINPQLLRARATLHPPIHHPSPPRDHHITQCWSLLSCLRSWVMTFHSSLEWLRPACCPCRAIDPAASRQERNCSSDSLEPVSQICHRGSHCVTWGLSICSPCFSTALPWWPEGLKQLVLANVRQDLFHKPSKWIHIGKPD